MDHPMGWLTQKFELSRGGSGHNLRPMEGMRGLAVFLVFLVHHVTFLKPWIADTSRLKAFAEGLHSVGNTRVDLFFVLSGFLIYGSLIKRLQSFIPFTRRRVARIYPAFMVVFLLYVGLSFVFKEENRIPAGVVAATIYLAHNLVLLSGIFPIEPLITVAWSLSYEMFYYLAIPLLIAACRLRRFSSAGRAGFFVVVACGVAVVCALSAGPIRLVMLISGILLCETIEGRLMRVLSTSVGLLHRA